MPDLQRVTVDRTAVSANNNQLMDFFVLTDSGQVPIVSLADNNGFPDPIAVYARPAVRQGHTGVQVTIHFGQDASNGNGLAINLYQPGATQQIVIPTV